VLPLSAYAESTELPARPPRRWWSGPLLAGVACVAMLLIAFVLVLPRLMRPRPDDGTEEPFDLRTQIDKGRRQMGQGKFRMARRTLDDAVRWRDRDPGAYPAALHRELNQLHRQADVLARLLNVTLADVVRHAQLSRDAEEWALRFEDFRGRSVIFDDAVGRDERDRPVLVHDVVEVKDERVRLALEDLTALHDLPLDDRPRLVFGARLAGCEREPGGGWVVRFDRDSGVLMTDADAVVAALTQPPDEGLKQVLARQQKWLDERAAVAPARP
jgi:hypothetical protein